jgi:GcrA cell cycle regulator
MAGLNILWPEPHFALMSDLVSLGLSSSRIATQLNERFGTSYTRCSVIGKAKRNGLSTMGLPLRKGEKRAPRVPRPPAVRAVPKPWREPRPYVTKAAIEAACAAIVPLGIRCEELEPPHCRWPYGDGPIVFCGHPRRPGHPYCESHWHLSRSEGTKSEREATSGLRRVT